MCNVQPMLGHTGPTVQYPRMTASFAENYFARNLWPTRNLVRGYKMFCFLVLVSLNSESFDLQHSFKMIYYVLDSGPISLFGNGLRPETGAKPCVKDAEDVPIHIFASKWYFYPMK